MRKTMSRILAFVLVVAMTVSMFTMVFSGEEPVTSAETNYSAKVEQIEDLLGDVNGDGRINTIDAVAILRHLAGYIVDGNIALGDYNSDGVTNSDDAVAILRMLAGYNN